MPTKLVENIHAISDVLWGIKDKETLELFLEDILTPKEARDIKERIQVVRLLNQGNTQREVAKEMGISITTVNRGARIKKWGTGLANELLK